MVKLCLHVSLYRPDLPQYPPTLRREGTVGNEIHGRSENSGQRAGCACGSTAAVAGETVSGVGRDPIEKTVISSG